MKEQNGVTVQVLVYDHTTKVLPNAKVTLAPLGEKTHRSIDLKFDKRKQEYCASDVKLGHYLLQAEADGFEPQEREAAVDPAGLKDIFILGKQGMPFYYKRHVKTPFEPRKDLLAVAVDPTLSEEQEHALNDAARELGLSPEEISNEIRATHVRLFHYTKDLSDAERQSVQERLEKHPHIRRVGPVIHLDARGLSFLTNEFIVRFNPKITREQAHATALAV